MNVEYINPFLQAATLVYREMLGLQLIRGRTELKVNPMPGRDIAILVSVHGSATGEVVYSMNIETVYKIVQKLVPDIKKKDIENEYRDVIGELGNMITGNAVNICLANDTDLDITVPMVVDARQGKLKFNDTTTVGLNLYSVLGLLEVNIALRKK